jgi:hypothetical protein
MMEETAQHLVKFKRAKRGQGLTFDFFEILKQTSLNVLKVKSQTLTPFHIIVKLVT